MPMSEQDLSRLAALEANMGHVLEGLRKLDSRLDRVVEELEEWLKTSYASKADHHLLSIRVESLERTREEDKKDGGFFGALRRITAVAVAVTAVVAACGAVLMVTDRLRDKEEATAKK